MKSHVKSTVALGLLGSVLAACGGGSSDSLDAQQKVMARSVKATLPACSAAWVSGTAYTSGAKVSYSSVNYTANFWTQGNNPSTSNGGAGSGQPWTSNGACTDRKSVV